MSVCAQCGEHAADSACAKCGADPLLDGRFRLDEPIGTGSSGTTWRATVVSSGEVVAIKEMLLRRATAAKSQEMLHREAAVLRQLNHPQIPAYRDHLLTGQGKTRSLWLVQAFVDGQDLGQELLEHRYTEDEVLQLLQAVCPVLTYLHGLSPPVVHRDIKPSNLKRAADGRLMLLDFGSVRDTLADPALGGSTVAGTFGYMAPEQFMGDATPQSDLYGLGALAVALLTRADPTSLLRPDRSLGWKDSVAVSPQTAELLTALLAATPADRPRSAQAVHDWADRCLRREASPPPSSGHMPMTAAQGTTATQRQLEALRGPTYAEPLPADEPEPLDQQLSTNKQTGALVAGGAVGASLVALASAAAVALLVLAGLVFVLLRAPAPPPPVLTQPPVAEAPAATTPPERGTTNFLQPIGWPMLNDFQIKTLPETTQCMVSIAGKPGEVPAITVQEGCPAPFTAAIEAEGKELWTMPKGTFVDGGGPLPTMTIPDIPVVWETSELPDRRWIEPITSTREQEAPAGTPVEVDSDAVTHRVGPRFPQGAPSLASIRCKVAVGITPAGQPWRTQVDSCPEAFHEVAHDAIGQWTWETMDSPGYTEVGVSFRQKGKTFQPPE